MTVKMTALRDVSGDYGTAFAGQTFSCDDTTAESLESRGLAERYRETPSRPVHSIDDFKMKLPTENKMVETGKNKRRA